MKTSLLSSSAALGLTPLSWNAFTQVVNSATYTGLAATFVPATITVLAAAGTSYYPSFIYRYTIGSGKLPSWVKAGAGVKIAASVTLIGSGAGASAVSENLSDYFIVSNVDPAGTYFDIPAPRAHASRDAVAITQALAATALDSGATTTFSNPNTPTTYNAAGQVPFVVSPGQTYTLTPGANEAGKFLQYGLLANGPLVNGTPVTFTAKTTVCYIFGGTANAAFTGTFTQAVTAVVASPLVTLSIQCQKAMLQCTTGSVNLSNAVDASNNAAYVNVLTPTSGEYEINAQPESKFDLADYMVSGTGTIAVRFE